MKKHWFEIRYNPKEDAKFVIKVHDEEIKNHKEIDQPINSPIILENKDDKF